MHDDVCCSPWDCNDNKATSLSDHQERPESSSPLHVTKKSSNEGKHYKNDTMIYTHTTIYEDLH